MSRPKLFGEFQAVSSKAWKQRIQFDLQGADYNETLVWESPEGLKVKPFYHADDHKKIPSPPIPDRPWTLAQKIYAGNATMANEKALNALSKGAEGLVLTLPSEEIQIQKLLKGIDLQKTSLHLDPQFLSVNSLQNLWGAIGDPKDRLYLHLDSIGHLARSGNWFHGLDKDMDMLGTLLSSKMGSTAKNLLSIDMAIYQNAGANMVQQLAYALAHANEYLNYLHQKKLVGLLKGITFKVAIGNNYFFEIAKLRALRLLWKTLAAEYGLEVDGHLLAFPTRRNKTLYDYNMNMLRTTTECMSAILGGADTIYNLPYDSIYNKDNDFSERIARNQLLLLRYESYFDRASNPADGAYYVEDLTAQLAGKALDLFKQIESAGGFLSQLKSHSLQKKIKESAQKEQQLFDAQKEILVGTNKYTDPKDLMKDKLQLYPFVKTEARKTLLEPLIGKRLAEDREQKRLGDE